MNAETQKVPVEKLPLRGWLGYGLAAVLTGLALAGRLALDPIWGEQFPYLPFFFAAFVVIQLADTGPSLAALLSGFVLGDWLFVAPRHSLLISGKENIINSTLYFAFSFVLWYFSWSTRQALRRERVARAQAHQHAEASAQLAAVVEFSDDAIICKSLEGVILSWNASAQRLYGYSLAEVVGRSILLLEPPEREGEMGPLLERVRRGEHINHFETVRRAKDGRLVEVSLSISPVRNQAGELIAASTIARDITERKRAEREREALVRQLQTALAEVKTLSGLLPICSHCKKIRDDQGYWNQIELYIRQHSNANFTHGICPECSHKLYPELFPHKPAPVRQRS